MPFLLDTLATPMLGLLGASWLGGMFAGWWLRTGPPGGSARTGPVSMPSPDLVQNRPGERTVSTFGEGVATGFSPLASSLRDLLAAATQHTDELISIATPDGAILWANPAYCGALGYDLTEIR